MKRLKLVFWWSVLYCTDFAAVFTASASVCGHGNSPVPSWALTLVGVATASLRLGVAGDSGGFGPALAELHHLKVSKGVWRHRRAPSVCLSPQSRRLATVESFVTSRHRLRGHDFTVKYHPQRAAYLCFSPLVYLRKNRAGINGQ